MQPSRELNSPATLSPLLGVGRRAIVVELAIAAVIVIVGAWCGIRAVQAFRNAGGTQYFYQAEFGPAVMWACGREFSNPDTRNVPAFDAFLDERSNSFPCAALPPAIPATELDLFQRESRYLELTVAVIWKLTGVSWSRLIILPGVLFGAVAALTYGLLRLALSRALALSVLLPSVTSTSNFMIVPHLRDYAKGPFLLAVIFIMGFLVVGHVGRRSTVALAALAGAVIGLGFGFRTDLIIAVVPFMLTVALLLPAALSMRTRMVAIAVFLASLLVMAWPMLQGYSKGGGNIGHVMLLGFATDFDKPLRIQPSVYEFVGQYNDSLAFTMINGYAIRIEHRLQGVDLASAEYEHAATGYLGEVTAVFPGDMTTRTLAAIRAVPMYFLDSSLYPPTWVQSEFLRDLYRLRARIFWRLAPLGAVVLIAATIGISMSNPRAAWLVVVVMIGFAGASAVQFHERHFYYLQFVPWWAFGLLAQAVLRGPGVFRRLRRLHVQRAVVFSATVAVCVGGAILLTRAYQQRTAARLFDAYETAPRTSLTLVQRDREPGRTLLAAQEWLEPLPPDSPRVLTRFLAVAFRDDVCGSVALPLTIRYEAALPGLDFSEAMTVPLGRGLAPATTLFFAAYDRPGDGSRFRGIELAPEWSRCVGGIFRIDRIERAPLLLTTVLATNWRDQALYQRLR